ncbi:MAG: hypothetical protein HFJ17_02895 [Clostridia bacterium]|nr:hypothetical protein [Clostridia bacterium]
MDETYTLESVLKDIRNKKCIISLLEYLIKEKINDFEYKGLERFDSISEYDFSLIKINIILENTRKKTIYMKIIKGGKIKESIFCYWSLIYKRYLNNNKFAKATITEKPVELNRKSIILNIDKDINFSTEIALIELRNYIIDNKEMKEEIKKLFVHLNIYNEDILFLGMI